jgi:hypothetical protein
MKLDELLRLEGSPPAILPDGRMALLIRWPKSSDDKCGFQVPGEDDICWYELDSGLNAGNGSLIVSSGR